MRTVSFLGTRGLVVLALSTALVLAAAGDDATAKQTTTGTTTKSQTTGGTTKSQAKSSTQTPSNPGQHPHIHAALHELKKAREQLHEARHDYGGHREHALKDVDHAIHQLEEALHYAAQHSNNGSPAAKTNK